MVQSDKPVLVTGASGFVGAAVARTLLAAGREVRALLRPSSDRRNVEGLAVDVRLGSLTEPRSLAAALEGCDALYHVAADYRLWVRNPATMYAVNVDGTRSLMEAALAAGVGRVVYTSSVATLGWRADGAAADETTPSALADMVGHYKRSKFLAEAAVRDLVRTRALPAVIVNPSTPVGPRDVKPTPTGRIIVEAASGRMPAYVDTGLNLVHVDDVARGHLLAEERGRVGERYILGGENLTLGDILRLVAGIVGRKPSKTEVPAALVWPVAVIEEALGWLIGREPFATREGLRMSRHKMFFSSAKAERELDYRARPAREGLADAVAWFRQAGMVR
ncbi:MAG: hopanoid-associated sugar epimerase [Stellaceae bacterium]